MTAASMHHKSTLDGLPKQFVSAMRTLFDLMDDKRTGFVRLSDIQSRWNVADESGGGGSSSLPNGAIECLRKVTPANGLLSFERFCAGLRICLLRHDNNSRTTAATNSPPPPPRLHKQQHHHQQRTSSSRPASVPIPEMNRMPNRKLQVPPVVKIAPNSGSSDRAPSVPNVLSVSPPPHPSSRLSCYNNNSNSSSNNTAAVRPNNVRLSTQQRATSMPHLQNNAMKPYNPSYNSGSSSSNEHKVILRRPLQHQQQPRMSKAMVAVALEKWRMMKSYHPPEVHASPPARSDVQVPQPLKENHQLLKRDAASYPNLPSQTTELTTGMGLHIQERGPAAKKANRKREPRRHTVSNGIDYNMIKRLKLLEQEKECLLQGLDVVERARNWYVQQIAAVTEKLERVSKYDLPHSDYSMDAHRERLNFQMTRIAEVNQHLNALMDTSEKGFPIHMNLAVQQHNIYDRQRNVTQSLQKLKEQNNVLKEEVSKKNGMITQLESEKSALIRELFLARSQQQKDTNDTTLW